MASIGPIAISDDEDEPENRSASADKLVSPDTGTKVNESLVVRDNAAESVHSSEEYDYAPAGNEIDLYDVSLHASDIEEGDIFAENLERFTELQKQTAERLAAEPVPLSPPPKSPSGAAKRSAPKTGGRSKRSRTASPVEAEDDDDYLEQLLMSSPAEPTTRRTRSGLSLETPVTPLPDTENEKVLVAESPVSRPESAVSVPEEESERTFTARVQVGRLIIRLQMKRTDRLQRLFDAVADELSLPARRVCLGQRDIIYSPHQTPDDVGLGPFDIIEFWEGDSAPAPAPSGAAAAVDPDSVELKVQSADRRSTVTLRLRRADPMSLLMERYATERGVSLEQLRFRFDGEALEPTDTADTLDLDGGECIDVHDCCSLISDL